jgi:MFS family permease
VVRHDLTYGEDGVVGDLGRAGEFPSGDFTRFWWAETVSSVGTYVTLVALPTLVVLTLDGTAQDVGWLNSARWLPYLAPLGGLLAVQAGNRTALVAAVVVFAVAVVLLVASPFRGVRTPPLEWW